MAEIESLSEFVFYLPTRLFFGEGVIGRVGEETRQFGQRAFVVTDSHLIDKIIGRYRVLDSLEKAGISTVVWDKAPINPPLDAVENGARLARKEKCDLIIGLGGGSVIDAAKGIAVLGTNSPPLDHYLGRNRIRKIPLPLIVIPTTAGTGSEVSPYAVFTNTKETPPEKEIMADPLLFPRLALVDPRLTLSLPRTVTRDSGTDALCHAIESYTSRRSQVFSGMLALEAIRILATCLPRVLEHPENVGLRSRCSYASVLAGMAIAQTGTTLIHGMGYKLTSHLGLSHGKANGILLPWVSEFNLEEAPAEYALLAESLGENVEDLDEDEPTRLSITGMRRILRSLGQPEITSAKEISGNTIDKFSREIAKDKRRLAGNPRPATWRDIARIYRKALGINRESQGGP